MKKPALFLTGIFLSLSLSCFSQSYSWNNLPKIQNTSFKADTFNITNFGAKADGITLNTKSINDAIATCSNKGGGVVLIPGGLWLTGPIELKSNVNLHVNRDGLLQFTTDFNQYKLVEGDWEGRPAVRNQSPVSGKNLENIAITGTGIIDGNGDAWRAVKKDKLTETQWKNKVASGGLLSEDQKTWYPSAQFLKGSKIDNAGVLLPGKTAADYADIKDFLRPNLLVLNNCNRVLLEGVTFQNSPAWCLHTLLCEDLTVKNVYAKNPDYAQNGDGIDVESCKNVLLESSTFDVGDDGICIKSGRDADGRKRGKPTENMIVKNCVVYHAHGGFVIGSEISGGARNLFVSDCTFIGTDIGLRFKTTRGRGGVVEKIYVKNIAMKDIVGEAILFDMYYMAKDPVPLAGEKRDAPKVVLLPVTAETPIFRDFHISNVVCNGASKAVFIRGLPEMKISDIYLDHLILTAKKGIDLQEAKNISFKDVHLVVADSKPVVNILNSSLLNFDQLQYNPNADLLFSVNGQSSDIQVKNTDPSKAKTKTTFNAGADSKALLMK